MDKYTFVKHITATQDPLNSFDLYKDESDQQFIVQKVQMKNKTFTSFSQEDSNLILLLTTMYNRMLLPYCEFIPDNGYLNIFYQYKDLTTISQASLQVDHRTKKIISWAHAIAQAIQYLHSNSVMHPVLSGSNTFVLLGDGNERKIFITSYGLSLFECIKVNPNYPPELVEEKSTLLIDSYLFGRLVDELCTKTPYVLTDPNNYSKILKEKLLSHSFSQHFIDVIIALLNPIPEERMTIEDFLCNPYIIDLYNKHKPKAVHIPQNPSVQRVLDELPTPNTPTAGRGRSSSANESVASDDLSNYNPENYIERISSSKIDVMNETLQFSGLEEIFEYLDILNQQAIIHKFTERLAKKKYANIDSIENILLFLFSQIVKKQTVITPDDLHLLIVYLLHIHQVFPDDKKKEYNDFYINICNFIITIAENGKINLLRYLRLYPQRILDFYKNNHTRCRALLLVTFRNATQSDIINILTDESDDYIGLILLCDLYKTIITKMKYTDNEQINNLKNNILGGISTNRLDELAIHVVVKYGSCQMLLDLYKISEPINKLEIEDQIKANRIKIEKKHFTTSEDMSTDLYKLVINKDPFYIGNNEVEVLLPKENIDQVVQLPDEINDIIMSDVQYGRLLRIMEKYKNLELIDIDGLSNSDRVEIFMDVLERSFSNVTELYISDYPIIGEDMRDLCDSLSVHKNIYHLGFSQTSIMSIGIKYLTPVISTMKNLTTLLVDGNKMGSQGAILLAKGLAKLTHLHEFNIADNNIQITGALAIVDGLKNHKDLVNVCFDNNNIEDTGMNEVLSILTNENVDSLSFSGNLISDRGCQMISNYLKEMKNVHSLDLSSNKITEHGVSLLTCRIVEYPNMTTFIIDKNGLSLKAMDSNRMLLMSTSNHWDKIKF